MLKSILIVGIGGFIGTALRFLIARYFNLTYESVFPWSTFLINIIGSLAIGLIFGLTERGNIISEEWRLFLAIGLCGGFTTFSTLSMDAFLLMQGKEYLRFATYTGLSFFLGLIAVFAGRALTRMV